MLPATARATADAVIFYFIFQIVTKLTLVNLFRTLFPAFGISSLDSIKNMDLLFKRKTGCKSRVLKRIEGKSHPNERDVN